MPFDLPFAVSSPSASNGAGAFGELSLAMFPGLVPESSEVDGPALDLPKPTFGNLLEEIEKKCVCVAVGQQTPAVTTPLPAPVPQAPDGKGAKDTQALPVLAHTDWV